MAGQKLGALAHILAFWIQRMADSLPKQLVRARHRAAQNREKIVELQAKKNGLDLEIAALEKMYLEDSAFCEDC